MSGIETGAVGVAEGVFPIPMRGNEFSISDNGAMLPSVSDPHEG